MDIHSTCSPWLLSQVLEFIDTQEIRGCAANDALNIELISANHVPDAPDIYSQWIILVNASSFFKYNNARVL